MTTGVNNPTPVNPQCSPGCKCGKPQKTGKTGGTAPKVPAQPADGQGNGTIWGQQQPRPVAVVPSGYVPVQPQQNQNSGCGFWSALGNGLKNVFCGLGKGLLGALSFTGGLFGFGGNLLMGAGNSLLNLAASGGGGYNPYGLAGGFGLGGGIGGYNDMPYGYGMNGMFGGGMSYDYGMNGMLGGLGGLIPMGIGAALGYVVGKNKNHCHGHIVHHGGHHHSHYRPHNHRPHGGWHIYHNPIRPHGSHHYGLAHIGNGNKPNFLYGSYGMVRPTWGITPGRLHSVQDPIGHHFGLTC